MNINEAKDFLSQLPLPAAHFEPSGEVVFLNSSFTKLLGYTKADIPTVEAHWPIFFPDVAYREKVQKDWSTLLEKSAKSGVPIQPMLLDIVAKNGEVKKLEVHSLQVGTLAITMWIDFTEKMKAEEELRIAAIAFDSEAGMMVTDLKGAILRINPAFTRLTGYSINEVIGKKPSILSSGRHGPEFYLRMWQVLQDNGYWQGEVWNRSKDGKIYAEWLTITAVRAPDGTRTHYVGVFSDITENKQAEAEVHRLAYYDELTRLPNRRLLNDRIEQALAGSRRRERYGALLFLDMDHFKQLNDTRGHDIGDMFLIETAQRLKDCLRETDTVARQGGDEFVILLEDLASKREDAAWQAEQAAKKIVTAIAQPFDLAGQGYHSTISIGIALLNQESTVESLFKQADMALYQSKEMGRNGFRFFDPLMQANLEKFIALEVDLRLAIEKGQLELYYQPQVSDTGRLIGAEALLRWHHPDRGFVRPDDFLPMAEQNGLILPVGQWVLKTACEQIKTWSTDTLLRELQLAVNVSAFQFRQDDFIDQVDILLEQSGIDAGRLKIELTESMMLHDINDTVEKMRKLKALGIKLSLDDFGTGHSSLSYLTQLPIEQLKIDKSFVINLPDKAEDAIVAQTIIAMAQGLRLDVIAEGVESEAQRLFLRENGCFSYQGYLFSRPVPLEEFEAFAQKSANV